MKPKVSIAVAALLHHIDDTLLTNQLMNFKVQTCAA
jgi:hypothetical protein